MLWTHLMSTITVPTALSVIKEHIVVGLCTCTPQSPHGPLQNCIWCLLHMEKWVLNNVEYDWLNKVLYSWCEYYKIKTYFTWAYTFWRQIFPTYIIYVKDNCYYIFWPIYSDHVSHNKWGIFWTLLYPPWWFSSSFMW